MFCLYIIEARKTEGTNQVWILVRLEIVFNEVLADPPVNVGSGITQSSRNISDAFYVTEKFNPKMAIQSIQDW